MELLLGSLQQNIRDRAITRCMRWGIQQHWLQSSSIDVRSNPALCPPCNSITTGQLCKRSSGTKQNLRNCGLYSVYTKQQHPCKMQFISCRTAARALFVAAALALCVGHGAAAQVRRFLTGDQQNTYCCIVHAESDLYVILLCCNHCCCVLGMTVGFLMIPFWLASAWADTLWYSVVAFGVPFFLTTKTLLENILRAVWSEQHDSRQLAMMEIPLLNLYLYYRMTTDAAEAFIKRSKPWKLYVRFVYDIPNMCISFFDLFWFLEWLLPPCLFRVYRMCGECCEMCRECCKESRRMARLADQDIRNVAGTAIGVPSA